MVFDALYQLKSALVHRLNPAFHIAAQTRGTAESERIVPMPNFVKTERNICNFTIDNENSGQEPFNTGLISALSW